MFLCAWQSPLRKPTRNLVTTEHADNLARAVRFEGTKKRRSEKERRFQNQ
jgi:hypothetical protein